MIRRLQHTPFVPAQAGTQSEKRKRIVFGPWVPAFAGTNGE